MAMCLASRSGGPSVSAHARSWLPIRRAGYRITDEFHVASARPVRCRISLRSWRKDLVPLRGAAPLATFLGIVGALNRKHEFLRTPERDEGVEPVDMLAAQLSGSAPAAFDPRAGRLSQSPLVAG